MHKLALQPLIALATLAAMSITPWAFMSQDVVQISSPSARPEPELMNEPSDQLCTGECLSGYRWASAQAINDELECKHGSEQFKQGCRSLVQDEMRERVTDVSFDVNPY
jgi:hypothetical protein